MTATSRSILRYLTCHSARLSRDELIRKIQPPSQRNQAQVIVTTLLATQTIARVAGDKLAPTAKALRIIRSKRKKVLSPLRVEDREERDIDWLETPLAGNIVTVPVNSVLRLRTRARRAPVSPMKMAKRLYVEASVVHSPRLAEYLFKLRTRSSEFRRDERNVLIDLNHAEHVHEWLGRAIKKVKLLNGRR